MKTLKFLKLALILMLGSTLYPAEKTSIKVDGLPLRKGPPPKTTPGVPHVQIGVKPVPAVHKEMFRLVFSLPGVENRPSIISLPGARGLWLSDSLKLVHPEVIIAGREFAHIHPDGSLHIALSEKRAEQAIQKGWAIKHPWASERKGLGGFVMLYTPQSIKELRVTFRLIVDSYNYITGKKIKAKDLQD